MIIEPADWMESMFDVLKDYVTEHKMLNDVNNLLQQ